ncbi:hypothetical protein [Nostoc sp. NZL]|uniref:hypothetical protein n=1 Tax=Nostoc sp. NZL TaxID=2650612 RepID=UPI0018C6BB84|nr:hypothetical protein [Nostoc sp. NZL]
MILKRVERQCSAGCDRVPTRGRQCLRRAMTLRERQRHSFSTRRYRERLERRRSV